MSIKMNPEAKIKVLEALRSGKYPQGGGQLRNSNGCFCVWGVIADLSGKGEWNTKPDVCGDLAYDGDTTQPTSDVVMWAGGTTEQDFRVKIDGKTRTIMEHNDDDVPFAKLADAIEEQL